MSLMLSGPKLAPGQKEVTEVAFNLEQGREYFDKFVAVVYREQYPISGYKYCAVMFLSAEEGIGAVWLPEIESADCFWDGVARQMFGLSEQKAAWEVAGVVSFNVKETASDLDVPCAWAVHSPGSEQRMMATFDLMNKSILKYGAENGLET